MSDSPSKSTDSPRTSVSESLAGKAPWHPPTLEEVDYSATEAAGAGPYYDFAVYSGSV